MRSGSHSKLLDFTHDLCPKSLQLFGIMRWQCGGTFPDIDGLVYGRRCLATPLLSHDANTVDDRISATNG